MIDPFIFTLRLRKTIYNAIEDKKKIIKDTIIKKNNLISLLGMKFLIYPR